LSIDSENSVLIVSGENGNSSSRSTTAAGAVACSARSLQQGSCTRDGTRRDMNGAPRSPASISTRSCGISIGANCSVEIELTAGVDENESAAAGLATTAS